MILMSHIDKVWAWRCVYDSWAPLICKLVFKDEFYTRVCIRHECGRSRLVCYSSTGAAGDTRFCIR